MSAILARTDGRGVGLAAGPALGAGQLGAGAVLLPVLLTALLLLWPAFYNGAPLIFSDTLAFPEMVLKPFDRVVRARGYALVGGYPAIALHSFWPVIMAQALLTAWLLHAVLRAILPGLGLAGHLLLGAGVALLTSAGWAASYVMPDALTAPGLLALFLLLARGPGRGTLLAAGAVVVLASASHITHALIMGCALGFGLLLRLVPWRRALLALACIGLGMGAVVGANRVLSGKAEYTRGGETFLAARLAGDGLMQRLLAERCPDPALPRLCAAMPIIRYHPDTFLWHRKSPFVPGGDFFALVPEFRIANPATIRAFWPEWVANSMVRSARQLLLVRPGDGLEQELMTQMVRFFVPLVGAEATARHAASRQLHVEMADDPLTWIAVPAALAGLALVPLLLVPASLLPLPLLRFLRAGVLPTRAHDETARLLLALVLAACLANALAVGFGGSEHARYTSRLAWLLPLAACVAMLRGRRPG